MSIDTEWQMKEFDVQDHISDNTGLEHDTPCLVIPDVLIWDRGDSTGFRFVSEEARRVATKSGYSGDVVFLSEDDAFRLLEAIDEEALYVKPT